MSKTRRAFAPLAATFATFAIFPISLVQAGTPTKLKITTAAQTVTAGRCSGSARVQTQDAYNAAATSSYSRTVALSSPLLTFYSDSYCSNRIKSRAIKAYSSSTTFYFKGTQAGSALVTASASDLVSATQTETIVPAAPTRLKFTSQPSNEPVNTPISPAVVVDVTDSYGNTVPGAAPSVTVSLYNNPTGATLSGSRTSAASNGRAVFSTLTVNKAGTGYTLRATASGLSSRISTSFNITAVTGTPTPTPTPAPSPTPNTGLRTIPHPIWGVTTDSVSNLSALIQSLQSLSRTPTTRVVFDEWVAATYYKEPVAQINKVSYVMGELLDSYYVREYTTEQYKARTSEYLNTLGNSVDIWEIGNEINGEWLGDTPTVVAKMTGAYDLVKARGARAALTLYYNEECWMYPSEEMFTWASKNVPDRMKQGLDYVFVSFYEDDCNGIKPDWPTVFSRLGTMFPNSKIGFGEVGTSDPARKSAYITRYYNMSINHPNYVGGYFWWYFRQDMVPYTNPLWTVLNDAIAF